jgi:regulator of replication initiation timing
MSTSDIFDTLLEIEEVKIKRAQLEHDLKEQKSKNAQLELDAKDLRRALKEATQESEHRAKKPNLDQTLGGS